MRNLLVRKLSLGGLFAALVMLFTYAIKLPTPATAGYIHLGDGIIFLCGMMLGPQTALIAAVGSALADLVGGYFVYILPTFVIKGLMGALAGRARREKVVFNACLFACAELVMVCGYFLFEGFAYGWAAAAGAILPNVVQGVAGVVLGTGLCTLLAKKELF